MATSFKAAFDKMVRIAKYSALIIAGVLTFAAKAAMDQEQALAKLVVVLKSTGHAAGLSLKQLVAHSKALQKVTVYGDETIQSMQALLLTFKSIRGEIFMRTTEAILDLSKAMGQDLQQSVIQIGKAINDPILGMTALRRVGIQFTTEQEKMIKGLVESGKLFEAQKVILAELESQFGGMSRIVETGWGKLKQMWNVLGDVAEVIGDALLPQIKESATAIKEWAERNIERIGEWAKTTVKGIGKVKDVFIDWLSYLKQDWKAGLSMALDVALTLLKGFWETSVVLMEAAGKAAGRAFVVAFGEPITKFADEWLAAGFWKRLADPAGSAMYAIVDNWAEVIKRYNKKMSEETVKETETTWERIKQIARKMAAEIKAKIKIEPDFITTFPPVMRFPSEPFSWEKEVKPYVDAEAAIHDMATGFQEVTKEQRKAAQEIDEVWTQMWLEQEAKAYHAMRTPIIAAEKVAKESAERRKRITEDIAVAMARSWTSAIDQMMFEGKEFWDAMQDMARSLIRTITEIIIYKKIAEPIAYTVMGLPVPTAQYGGTVERTGLAVIHKGETFSGVSGGKLEVNVNYSGQERPVISEAGFDFKRQVLNITMEAAEGNGPYRRSHNLRR